MLLTILSIVRSTVMGLKNYCWDKSGFASCKLYQFLQTRFCHIFSSQTYYYFYLFQIVELIDYIEPTGASGLYIHPTPDNVIDPFLRNICYILRNGWFGPKFNALWKHFSKCVIFSKCVATRRNLKIWRFLNVSHEQKSNNNNFW